MSIGDSPETVELLRNIWQEIRALGDNLGGRIDQTNARLDQTNARLDQTNVELRALGDKVSVLGEKVDELDERMGQLTDRVERVEEGQRQIVMPCQARARMALPWPLSCLLRLSRIA